MKRAHLHVATLTAPLLLALGLSCTTQPVVLPSRDFNRPTDITFVCMGAVTEAASAATAPVDAGDAGTETEAGSSGGNVLTGLPMRVCHPRGSRDPLPSVSNRTFAFLPNSESGELAVIDADDWKLVNLDPGNFGYNQLPLGVLPTQIAASDDGCRVVTANHGSCDLSLVDPAALLAKTFASEYPTVSTSAANPIVTTTVVPKTSAGVPLRLLPGEVNFLPRGTTQLPTEICGSAWSWQALVTFPSCDLVALIDLPSGEIKKAAYVRPTKTATGTDSVVLVPLADGEAPVCPTDCAASGGAIETAPVPMSDAGAAATGGAEAGVSEAGVSDAATAEAGAPATPAPGPAAVPAFGVGPLAIVPESGRAYVGLANAPFVVAFDVATNVLSPAAGGGAIPLDGAVGVNRIRLSIDPYLDKTAGTGSTGISGTFIGNAKDPNREYLYVVARDGTLRVVQVAHAPESECETNFDPLSIGDQATRASILQSACIPIDPQHRRPGAIGPGIRPPTPPIDVAVADVSPNPVDQSETSVSGVHAWMITASGSVYLINIDPVQRDIAYVTPSGAVDLCAAPPSDCFKESDVFGYAPLPNTVRNSNVLSYSLSLDSSEGLPRLDVPSSESSIGPRIEAVYAQGSRNNETALTSSFLQTEVFFPDLTSVTPQTWTITWQGALTSGPRLSGEVPRGGTTLQDFGADFCRMGAEPTDLVTLAGCTDDTQCGLGKTCVGGTEGTQGGGGLPITGLCLAPGTAAATCDRLLSTVRRYDVTTVTPTALGIAPHKDELVLPSLDPCVPKPATGADGGAGADAGTSQDAGATDAEAGVIPRPKDVCLDPADPTTSAFQCVGGRCLMPCSTADSTQNCRAGRICVVYGVKPPPFVQPTKAPAEPCDNHECFCADGPNLALEENQVECLGELIPYEVNTGRSFVVAGSETGVPVTQTATTTNGAPACAPITATPDARDVYRISLDAPHCAPPIVDDNYDSNCDPNVTSCSNLALVGVDQSLGVPNPCLVTGGPNVTDQTPTTHTRALFRNREIQFMMTNLEQPLSGLFQVRFDVHGGFQPQVVTIPTTVEVTMPARIVLGPFDSNLQTGPITETAEIPYLFVVDQRRLGRTQGGGPTRGQLLRIHPRGLALTTPATGSAPWFEDLTHSNNLFPMQ